MQPIELLLCQMYSNFITFILGGQFLLPGPIHPSHLPADDSPLHGCPSAVGEAGDVLDVGVGAEGVRGGRLLPLGERGRRAADLGQEDAPAVLGAAHPAAPHQLRDLGRERPLRKLH